MANDKPVLLAGVRDDDWVQKAELRHHERYF